MKRLLPLLLLSLLLLACAPAQTLSDTSFFAMDTVITLRLPADTPASVISETEALVLSLEALFSRTDETSEIHHFNTQNDNTMTVSPQTASVIAAALSAAQMTNGAYDPTTAPLSDCWNITSDTPTVPLEDTVASLLPFIGYEYVTLDGTTLTREKNGVMLDLGGCAKGWACGAAVTTLMEHGVPYGIVSFGGNIGVFGAKPDGSAFRIALRHPRDPAGTAGFLTVNDGYVSVSGDYERYFEQDGIRYHHIFDANTGYPADSGVHAAVVWSRDAALADALSTAMFVMGADKGMDFYQSGAADFEALWYLADGTAVITPGIAEQYEHTAPQYRLVTTE